MVSEVECAHFRRGLLSRRWQLASLQLVGTLALDLSQVQAKKHLAAFQLTSSLRALPPRPRSIERPLGVLDSCLEPCNTETRETESIPSAMLVGRCEDELESLDVTGLSGGDAMLELTESIGPRA